jgi:hypothetical protein
MIARMITIGIYSSLTRKFNQMVLPMTTEEFDAAYDNWKGGAFIQNAFPNLSPIQREFLMSGMSEQEQNEFFGDADDEVEGY